MDNFRNIINWLLMAVIFCGCTDMESIENPVHPEQLKPITFSGFYNPTGNEFRSRATSWPQFTQNDSIIVYATHTQQPDDNTFTSNFMKKQIVKFDGNTWSYSPLKYWPADGKLTFRGYYPANVTFDEKNNPDNGLIYHIHTCNTGFEPLYAVEAVVNANNGQLTGDVSDNGILQLAFKPLLNKINFTAKVESGLFDEVDTDEYTNCRFLIINFRIWGLNGKARYNMSKDTWTVDRSAKYVKSRPLNLSGALAKKKVSEAVPGYVYNPTEGYCTDSAVVVEEAADAINIFNNTLHLIPLENLMLSRAFEIQYVVLTNKVDKDGNNVYKESGIITREISLNDAINQTGLIKKLININLDFSIDAVTVTRNLQDYIYKPMF